MSEFIYWTVVVASGVVIGNIVTAVVGGIARYFALRRAYKEMSRAFVFNTPQLEDYPEFPEEDEKKETIN